MPKTKKGSSSSSSDSGPEDRTPSKKTKTSDKTEKDDSGEKDKWTLDKMRFATISEFRGVKRVDIREFYEKDGKTLPGKKGISLSINQWKRLLDAKDEITKAMEE